MYLQLDVKIPASAAPTGSHRCDSGSQPTFSSVAVSYGHMIAICNFSCQLPTSKVNEEASRKLSFLMTHGDFLNDSNWVLQELFLLNSMVMWHCSLWLHCLVMEIPVLITQARTTYNMKVLKVTACTIRRFYLEESREL